MKKRLIVVIITLILLLAVVIPVSAITEGWLDGNDHPHVVLLLMDINGEPTYRCSATMLSPTVVLTAGHCTSNYGDPAYPEFPNYSGMRIYTESDVDQGTLDGTNFYPKCGGDYCIEASEWYAHPLYETAPFYFHDVGIVILEEEYYPTDDEGNVRFGTLPAPNALDTLENKRGKQKDLTWFTAVGYGLQRINPVFVEADRVRMVSTPKLIQINTPGFTGDFSLLLSNNHSTGGTCFGDSGGPNFLEGTNVIAGVTSYGMNWTCAGTGGVYRIDQADDLDWINEFLNGILP